MEAGRARSRILFFNDASAEYTAVLCDDAREGVVK